MITLCPCCGAEIKLYDHCHRHYIDLNEENPAKQYKTVVIPRYRCTNPNCPHKYHRAIPMWLLPYKRYPSEIIEKEINKEITKESVDIESDMCTAEESTIRAWKTWFWKCAPYFEATLIRIHFESDNHIRAPSFLFDNFPRLGNWKEKHGFGWLSRIVRITPELLLQYIH